MPPSPSPIAVFDRATLRRRRDRAARSGAADFLFAEAASQLAERLEDVARRFPTALALGCRGELMGRALAGCGGIERLVAADPSPLFAAQAAAPRLAAEPEFLPFAAASFDLVLG